MGLLCTTVVENRVSYNTITDPALTRAQERTADATEKLADATQNVADAINETRINISHSRYAELVNKSKLLMTIKKQLKIKFSIAYMLAMSDEHKKYIEYSQVGCGFSVRTQLFDGTRFFKSNDKYLFVLSESDKTFSIHKEIGKSNKVYLFYGITTDKDYVPYLIEEPEYIVDTEGYVDISGTEYHDILKKERELELNIDALNSSDEALFSMLKSHYYSYGPDSEPCRSVQEYVKTMDGEQYRYRNEYTSTVINKNNIIYHIEFDGREAFVKIQKNE
jgi:hypothetical protein